MDGQLSIFDLPSMGGDSKIVRSHKLTAPLCYDCEFAIRRGAFRLCQKGGGGYRKIGKFSDCNLYHKGGDSSEKQKKSAWLIGR